MTGTIPIKLARLFADLLLHPPHLRRYLEQNVCRRRSPLELELPWFSYAAIDFLDGWLRPDMRVCEYGSGGSTLFFARRARSVFSIEDHAEWFDRVERRLRERGIANVTLRLCPFDFKNPEGLETSAYLNAIPETLLDIIVVDSTEEWIPVRPALFAHAERHVRRGGIIVVDDSWRYPSLRTNHLAHRFETFQSAGPGRPGVTTTDVFFY